MVKKKCRHGLTLLSLHAVLFHFLLGVERASSFSPIIRGGSGLGVLGNRRKCRLHATLEGGEAVVENADVLYLVDQLVKRDSESASTKSAKDEGAVWADESEVEFVDLPSNSSTWERIRWKDDKKLKLSDWSAMMEDKPASEHQEPRSIEELGMVVGGVNNTFEGVKFHQDENSDAEKQVTEKDGSVYRNFGREVFRGNGPVIVPLSDGEIKRLEWWDELFSLGSEDGQEQHSRCKWRTEFIESAQTAFINLEPPHKKYEAWRHFNRLEQLYQTQFDENVSQVPLTQNDLEDFNFSAVVIVMKDGIVDWKLSTNLDSLPASVYVKSYGSLSEAQRLKFHPEVIFIPEHDQPVKAGHHAKGKKRGLFSNYLRPYYIFEYGKHDLGLAKWAALNLASAKDPLCVYVDEDVLLENPIHILHVTTRRDRDSKPISSPRLTVIAGQRSRFTLSQSHIGLSPTGLINSVTRIVMGNDSVVHHDYSQEAGKDAFHFEQLSVKQAARSNYTFRGVSFGSYSSRINSQFEMNDQKCHTESKTVQLARGNQSLEMYSCMWHRQPHSTSDTVHRNIVSDHGFAAWKSRGRIEQFADGTDASQICRSLMLSPKSKVIAMPVLEMMAPQIKASHGATVSDLNEDEINYMRARGLSKEVVRYLLLKAFASELISPMVDTRVKKRYYMHLEEFLTSDTTASNRTKKSLTKKGKF